MKTLRFVLVIACAWVTLQNVSAQSADTRWNGNDIASVSANEKVYLYNVGLGKLLINGGDWGTEGRLFYQDFGKGLNVEASSTSGRYFLTSNVGTTDGVNFGINVPGVTNGGGYQDGKTTYVVFDAPVKTGQKRTGWIFTRVETDQNATTYTYYMSEIFGGVTYYLGGAYGAESAANQLEQHGSNYDKCDFTSLNVTSSEYGDLEKTINGNTTVTVKELYQWRLVTETELEKIVESQSSALYGGLNANISYKIADQDFTRGDKSFYSTWNVVPGDGVSTTDEGYRYKFTWGFTGINGNDPIKHRTQDKSTTEAWNAPVRIKQQYNNIEDAKYGYMIFEGIGSAYTTIAVPKAGWYEVKCYGFHMTPDANDGHKAYAFASVNGTTDDGTTKYGKAELTKVTELATGKEAYGTVTSDTKYIGCNDNEGRIAQTLVPNGTAAGGYILTRNQVEPYEKVLFVEASSDGQILTFGVRKDNATKSEVDSTVTTTNDFYYISASYNGDIYYLTSNDNVTLSMTTNKNEAIKWTSGVSSNVSYTRNGNTYYLCHHSVNGTQFPYISESSSDALNYYGIRGKYYLYYTGPSYNSRYYLRIFEGQMEFYEATNSSVSEDGRYFMRSSQSESISSSYYHDMDWVGIDNFQITYLGHEPFVLDELATDATYMTEKTGEKALTNTTILLKRGFTLGEWNSLVLPVNMTTAQVKQTFGDNTKLAKLKGLKDEGDVIEFEQVPLPSDGVAIKKNKLYIIKPTLGSSTASFVSPTTGEEVKDFYVLGRIDFDGTSLEIPTVTCYKSEGSASSHASDGLEAKGTYIYLNDTTDITKCCPAGSYVLRKGDMYHTTKKMGIKGFRGWIEDVNQTSTGSSKFNSFIISDKKEDLSAIHGLQISQPQLSGNVYDLNGQLVRRNATSLDGLRKGIYIVNRKKVVVK